MCVPAGTCLRIAPTRLAVRRVRGSRSSSWALFQFIFDRASTSVAAALRSVFGLTARTSSGCGTYMPGVGAEVLHGTAGVDDHALAIELQCGSTQRRQLTGTKQVRRRAALDPQQFDGVDLLLIGGLLESFLLRFVET
jgi:hypothetical protein